MGDIDFKQMLTAILICLMIMIGWNLLRVKYAPPPPAEPPAPAPTTQEQTKKADEPLPKVQDKSVAEPKTLTTPTPTPGVKWRVLGVKGPFPETVFGSRRKADPYKAQITFDSGTGGDSKRRAE